MPVLLFGCKKEPLETNPLAGEWELLSIENNLGGTVMESPYSQPEVSLFRDDGYYYIGLHWGNYSLYEGSVCDFDFEATFAVGLTDEQSKWSNMVKRLHQRVDKYEVKENTLILKSEFKQLRFVKD